MCGPLEMRAMPDENDIEITANGYKVHVGEKVSTGDYENHQIDMTVEGDVSVGDDVDFDAQRDYIRRTLLAQLRDMQKVAQQVGENRIAIEDAEEWSDPRS